MLSNLSREFKNKIGFKKAIIVICIALVVFIVFLSPVASTDTRKTSSLQNIDWGLSPQQVEFLTKDNSRDTEYSENGTSAVLTQWERITDSELGSKSFVEYTFENNKLKAVKITKTIKYWPDYFLDQLLRETVARYEINSVFDTLFDGKKYYTENPNEQKLIYLGYDDLKKPEYAYVELQSKHTL